MLGKLKLHEITIYTADGSYTQWLVDMPLCDHVLEIACSWLHHVMCFPSLALIPAASTVNYFCCLLSQWLLSSCSLLGFTSDSLPFKLGWITWSHITHRKRKMLPIILWLDFGNHCQCSDMSAINRMQVSSNLPAFLLQMWLRLTWTVLQRGLSLAQSNWDQLSGSK